MDEAKLLELHVNGVKEAATRSRVAFFIMIFACGTILITLYNNYFAWNRILQEPNYGLSEWPPPRPEAKPQDPPIRLPAGMSRQEWDSKLAQFKNRRESLEAKLEDAAEIEEAKNLVNNQAIAISLLGIRLSSADLDIFGSLGLMLTSMYYLLCVRRTTLETANLFSEASSVDLVSRRFIHAGVRQSYVLNSAIDESHSEDETEGVATRISRWLFPKLTFVPTLTLTSLFTSDWYYILIQNGKKYGGALWWWHHLDPVFRTELAVMQGGLVFLGSIVLMTNVSTHRILQQGVRQVRIFSASLAARQNGASPLAES